MQTAFRCQPPPGEASGNMHAAAGGRKVRGQSASCLRWRYLLGEHAMRPQSDMQREAGSEAPCCLAGGGGALEDWRIGLLQDWKQGRKGWRGLAAGYRQSANCIGKQLDELQHRHVKRVEQEREGGGEEGWDDDDDDDEGGGGGPRGGLDIPYLCGNNKMDGEMAMQHFLRGGHNAWLKIY
jgi:hypothetical protein